MGNDKPRKGIENELLEPLIWVVRGDHIMLDADLARVYGVATMRFNEAFKRNRHRFPADFAFRLTAREYSNLISQNAISSSQSVDSLLENANRTRPAKIPHGGRRHLPWAFTEHGALMAANVIRSERAVHMSIYVIRAFVRSRERAASDASILKRPAEIDLHHDAGLRDIYRKLLPLLQPPPDPPRRRIGFHADGD